MCMYREQVNGQACIRPIEVDRKVKIGGFRVKSCASGNNVFAPKLHTQQRFNHHVMS